MRLLIDFAPIVVFVLVYYYAPELLELFRPIVSSEVHTYLTELPKLSLATAVLIPLTGLQVLLTYALWKKIEKMHLMSFFLVLILGSLTVVLKDKSFIQWKPTVLNWLFALVFLGSHFIGQKPIIERFMDTKLELPKTIWTRLSYAWIGFFIFAGTANILVVFNFSLDFWVNFKFFGMLAITSLFIIAQGIYIAPHLHESSKNEDPTKNS